MKRSYRRLRFFAVCIAAMAILTSCGNSQESNSKGSEELEITAGEDVTVNEVNGCLCRIDLDAMTMEIAPLMRDDEGQVTGFDTSQPQSLRFTPSTKIKAGQEGDLSVENVLGGKPISDDMKQLGDLVGNKVSVTWVERKDEKLSTEISLILGFAGESFASMVGSQGPTAIRWSTKCSCEAR